MAHNFFVAIQPKTRKYIYISKKENMVGFAKNIFIYKVLIFSVLIVGFCGISRADKRTNKLYELYNSTSTSANHKRILKHFIDKKERFEKMRATMSAERRRVLSAPTAIKTTGISSIAPSAADSAFKLG
ncbi:MAG: hypothetical protein L6420_09545, partial [Elusimicrobia bacterium]|nr:hypothetical protein [Elusimicrobiota bacterium]